MHVCHAPGCLTIISPRLHMCARHWFMLPKALRDEIWRTYRPGQEHDKRPSAEYMAAFAATTSYIRSKEAAPRSIDGKDGAK